ncbi:MAG TPA: four helix bundle protein [Nitrospirae bacterium]|nr:four helix bundle protein [Nitrospirota bacterium]HDZ01182.1 four helix bundle protein [Nitrospirota bacterium]
MKNTAFRAHKKLDVWNEAVALATDIYKVTDGFPKTESYGITSQMRRAAVSVPSNIAEGAARSGKKEFVQFLNIAGSSLSELDTQMEISFKLGYISQAEKQAVDSKISNVAQMLAGLIKWAKKGRE